MYFLTFRLSNQKIGSVSFNITGDWIALGSEGIGQLVVWEWQSESFVMKQQGHFNNMNCLAYSPDGMYIASGGEDGKVICFLKLSFCVFVFNNYFALLSHSFVFYLFISPFHIIFFWTKFLIKFKKQL